jgi:hypothetical protein
MKRTLALAAILVLSVAGIAAVQAQTTPMPVPPPVSPAMPQPPGSAPSPILTQPWLLHQPYGRAAAPVSPPATTAPIDQQKMQSYRSDLLSQQRALDRQGVSPGSPQYRDIQQQLQQPTR